MSIFGEVARPEPNHRGSLPFDVGRVRRDFPALHQSVHGMPLVYLDNAATTHKPLAVTDAVTTFYQRDNSNIHRGVHELSARATRAYESARSSVARILNAQEDCEVVFTKGTTEAINLVANTYGRKNLKAGDEVLITAMEHHSNIVPWQLLCEAVGAQLKVAPIDDRGQLILEKYREALSPKTKLVSICHTSNALGTMNPVQELIEWAHEVGAVVLLDGAQAVPHTSVDVQKLDCDFYAFSGHKLYGPTGIGALYGKKELLNAMPPWQGGGDMIKSVTFEKTEYNDLPFKFEAGTPNVAGAVGLAAAIDYVEGIGVDVIASYEQRLLEEATRKVSGLPGVRLIGTAQNKSAVLSFVLEGVHPHDIGTILDTEGVAIRAGHHCAQPVMARFGVPATARASFSFYNTSKEIDILVAAIKKVSEVFC